MNYYIKGDAANAEGIKAAFNKLGNISNADKYNYKNGNVLYFTAGDMVHMVDAFGSWANIIKTHPDYKELELPVEPCFKVGDKIEATIYGIKRRVTIREVDKTNRCYFGTLEECIGFSEQDQWHLAPKPHYDIKNFHAGMPVLVRDNNKEWRYVPFSHITNGSWIFNAVGTIWEQCIPFDGNEHLLGTTDMCDEKYINW